MTIHLLAQENDPRFQALHTPLQWRDWIIWKHASKTGRTLRALLTQIEIYEQLGRRVGNQVEALEREAGLVLQGDEVLGLIEESGINDPAINGALLKTIERNFNLFFAVKEVKEKKGKGPQDGPVTGEAKSALIRKLLDQTRYALNRPVDRICRLAFPDWEHVWDKIPHMGAIPCAKLRWQIGAIERFRSAASLRHYFGAHLTDEGHRPRRVSGVQLDYVPKIGPIIFNWANNLLAMGRKDDPNTQTWKKAMVRRIDYEMSPERNPEQKPGPAFSAARFWIFQKLCSFIWCEWAEFAGLKIDERDRKSLSFLYYPERYAAYATWPPYWSGNRKDNGNGEIG